MEASGPVFLCNGTAWETQRTKAVTIGWTTDKAGPTVITDEKTAKLWGVAISLESSLCSFEAMNKTIEVLSKNRGHLLSLSSQAQAEVARAFFGESIELVKDDGTCPDSRSKLRYLLDQLDQLDAWEALHKRPERPDTPEVRAMDAAIAAGHIDNARIFSSGFIARRGSQMTIEQYRARGCRGVALIHGGGRPPFIASGIDSWDQDAYLHAKAGAELRDLKEPTATDRAEGDLLGALRVRCPAYQITVQELIPVAPGHPVKEKQRRPGWYVKARLIGACQGVQVLRATESRPTRREALELALRCVGELRDAHQIVTIGIGGLKPPAKPPGGAALNPWVTVPDERADCDEPTTPTPPEPVFVGVDVTSVLCVHGISLGAPPIDRHIERWDDLRGYLRDLAPARVVIDADPAVPEAQAFADEMNSNGIPTYLIRRAPQFGRSPGSFQVDHEKRKIAHYSNGYTKAPQVVFAEVARNMCAPPPKPAEVWCVEYLQGDRVGYVAAVNAGHHYRPWTRVELRNLALTSDLDKARGFRSEAVAAEYASGSEGALRACLCQEVLPPLEFDPDVVLIDHAALAGPPKIDPSKVSIGRCEVFVGPAGEKPTTSLGTLDGPIKLTVNKARAHPATALQVKCIQNAIEERQVMIEFRTSATGPTTAHTCPSPKPRIDIMGCAPPLPPKKWTKIAEGPTEWDAYSRALIYLLKRT